MIGVLLMAYGTPAAIADVEAYYTHIRRGRPPTADQVADLVGRYEAIGGTSPLLARTRAQAGAIQRALGDGFVVELGMKHAPPFIEDAVEALAARGDVDEVVGVVLAPHYSSASVGEYAARATAVDADLGITVVTSWHLEPELTELLAERVREAQPAEGDGREAVTLFTAHSLPTRVIDTGDPYAEQVQETAKAVAAAAGLAGDRWRVAWQSAGRTPEPWIGPDICEVIPALAADGATVVVVCPCGFVADHLEVLYDVDIQARAVAEAAGIELRRTPSLNDDPRFIAMLARVAREAAS